VGWGRIPAASWVFLVTANAGVAPTAKFYPKRLFGDFGTLSSIPITKTTLKVFGMAHDVQIRGLVADWYWYWKADLEPEDSRS